jgi:flagellar motor protein MotB
VIGAEFEAIASSEDDGVEQAAPVWAVFGDLMAGVVGAFVLILISVLAMQMDLVTSLQAEIEKRHVEEARRIALEKALAIPLQSGRVTLNNGRIGISGSVLFDLNSDELREEGRLLLKSLVPPLQQYLGETGQMLMVSGFTDDRPIQEGNLTRSLIAEGMPRAQVFSAAFGAEQPVASNEDAAGRALNRRVEMAPVPRTAKVQPGADGKAVEKAVGQ